jgi:hypothetical protein
VAGRLAQSPLACMDSPRLLHANTQLGQLPARGPEPVMPPAAGWSTGDVEALEALAVVLVVEVDAGGDQHDEDRRGD